MTIAEYYKQAEFALAAYGTLTAGTPDIQSLKGKDVGMATLQAGNFAETYNVITQYNDTAAEGGLGTGLSVSVFQNKESKQLTVAIRGTELADPRDVSTDVGMIAAGVAYDQVVALYNWWKRETGALGTQVTQYRLNYVQTSPQAIALGPNYWLEPAGEVNATGGLIPALAADPDHKVEVTGHSLGGHLAMAFSTLFAPFTTQATVFNAPGFKDTVANQAFFAALGGTVPAGGPIINVIADEANIGNNPLNVAAGINSRPGTAVGIAIENQWQSDETATPAALNHSQQTLTDALAVYAMLAKLDPALTTASFKHILNAEVNGTAGSLEGIVDAIEKLLGIDNNRMPTGNTNRDLLFQALDRMQNGTGKAAYEAAVGAGLTIRDLSIFNADQIANIAKDNIAYRYALKAGNPFALIGVDYTTLHNPNGELEIYDKTSGQGQLTEEWITDRSKFLTWMIKANTDDKTAISDSRSEQWVAEDKTLKGASEYLPYSLDIYAGLLGMTGDARKMIFGKDQSDGNIELIAGAAKDDRLYGGGGDDKITGEAGNDYIEGNAGNDQLLAGDGTDTLLGGAGLDILTGGLGNDLLLGGKDADTYLINAGDGNDTLIDSDGQGHIEWAGLTLKGDLGLNPGQWRKLGSNHWQDLTNHLNYSLVAQSDGSDTLTIIRNGQRLQIKQWTAGQLGITLGAGTPASLPATPSKIYGDRAPIDFDLDTLGVQTQTDALGNIKTNPDLIEANRIDTLYDSAANDLILAGGGDDYIDLLRGGNDIAQGGDGADIIDTTGSGNKQLEGNAGADLIAGDQGNDILYGGDKIDFTLAASQGETAATLAEKGDLLDGKGGNDQLIGTATSDLLTGGAGDDILLGGGGDDVIYGDADVYGAFRGWNAQRNTIQFADHTEYQVTFTQALFSENTATAGVDVIYGGAGDDWIFAGAGNDILLGGSGADVIFGEDGNNLIDGGTENDVLVGGTGDDFIVGGEGNDTLQGSDYLHKSETGRDTLDGGIGNDALSGMAGDDVLIGGRGDDGLFGGSGNDTYQVGAEDGSDWISDESGSDTLELAVARSAVTLTRSGTTINLNWGAVSFNQGAYQTQYSLGIEKGTAGTINHFRFADRSLSASELLKSLDPLSQANYSGDAGSPTMGAGDELATLSNTSTTADTTYLIQNALLTRVNDAGGVNDTVNFGLNNSTQTSYRRLSNDDLVVTLGSGAEITLQQHFAANGSHRIEILQFADGNILASSLDNLIASLTPATPGDDLLLGTSGNDTLEGQLGNDNLQGGTGDDRYHFSRGDGVDTVIDQDATAGNHDRLQFDDRVSSEVVDLLRVGNDLVVDLGSDDRVTVQGQFAATANEIEAIQFADSSEWNAGEIKARVVVRGTDISEALDGLDTLDDKLFGLAGDDILQGKAGNDQLTGGTGNDALLGGTGNDTYQFATGDGVDVVVDNDATAGNNDSLRFSSVKSTEVTLSRLFNNSDLVITSNGTDRVTVQNQFYTPAYEIEQISFSDGVTWNLADIKAHLVTNGTAGNEVISGLSGTTNRLYGLDGIDTLNGAALADTLVGGHGNDVLQGGLGSDTYVFARGDGLDTIRENDATAGNTDVLQFVDIRSDAITELLRVSNDLVIKAGAADQVTIQSYFSAPANEVEQINFSDGVSWNTNDVKSRVATMGYAFGDTLNGFNGVSNHLYGLDGADTLNGGDQADLLDGGSGNDTLNGQAGNDTLLGGLGNDSLIGGSGNDTYVIAQGSGWDRVIDGDSTIDNLDTLEFVDINATDVTEVRRVLNDLVIKSGVADQVTVRDHFLAASNEIERFRFKDGVVWTAASVRAGITAIYGTSVGDTFYGSANESNVVYGLGDNDTLVGGSLADMLDGGNGNDRLDGQAGADILVGGLGDDTFVVDVVGDVVVEDAGAGTDTVESSIDFDLSVSGPNLENLKLTGSSALNGTGNALDNSIWGNSLSNVLVGSAGNDRLYGMIGIDSIDGGIGNDYLDGGDGDDNYYFGRGSGQDQVDDSGGANDRDTLKLGIGISPGDITLTGMNDQRSVLLTLAGSTDTLTFLPNRYYTSGMNGSPVMPFERFEFSDGMLVSILDGLVGTAGDDDLFFYANKFNLWGGYAEINIQVDGGLGNDEIRGSAGKDLLHGGAGNDVIYGDRSGTYGESLTFSDDTLYGDEGDDTLYGGGDTDVLHGGTGNDVIYGDQNNNYSSLPKYGADTLYGNEGDDTLSGGGGMDLLDGGAGNDILKQAFTVRYGRNYGQDRVILGASKVDLFDLLPTDISLQYQADGLYFHVNGSTDWLKIETTERRVTVSTVKFADGSTWDAPTIETMIAGQGNLAPRADVPLIQATAIERQAFSYVLPENAFRDPNPGDLLTWSGTGPAWLSFDPVTRTLSGTPGMYDVGSQIFTVIAHDSSGASGVQYFEVMVENINDAPTVNLTIPDLTAQEDTPFSEVIPEGAFADVDPGDVLTYSATLSNGNPLPSGVTVDSVTGKISGTPAIGEVGNFTIQLVATDMAGLAVTTQFTLSVQAAPGEMIAGTSDNDLLFGKSGDDLLVGGAGADTMSGGKGSDTYVVDSAGDTVIELSNQGYDTVESSISLVLADNFEALTLTGTSALNATGNALNNQLVGNNAANLLDGGAGNDTMAGGAGDDTYVVDASGDKANEQFGEGTDLVLSSATFTLAAEVENLTLTGTATINGSGNDSNNTLIGNGAANILNGWSGADTMRGGAGNDTYVVDSTGDVVTENLDEGTDLVQSAIIYVLGANLENLTLTGTAVINGTGNAFNNTLTGNSVANILDGGVGADKLIGGAGNDTYLVDDVADVITEGSNAGTDSVLSSVSYTLAGNVENLTLTGAAVINGTGNTLNNILIGNTAANILNGGAGTDTMQGGAGDDTYVVDNTGDVITESASAGIDQVQSSVTYSLAGNVENLTLTGNTAINGTGNTLNNVLTGNSAANVLSGGAGDDTYVVGTGDTISEAANAGTDLVQSSITWTLAANVENLTLTGTAAINGTGNTTNNVITGNSGANILDGGTGADTLRGGAGNDTYVIDNAADIVSENLNEGTDLIQSSITYTLAANIENLTLTGTTAINGMGNELANKLTGNSAANVLNGGAGADTLVGGTGDDTYVIDDLADVVTEAASAGTDLVQSSVTHTLAANVEKLMLTGVSAINATGNTLDNVLTGNSAANILNGGTGADTMLGGLGDDTYTVDNVSDFVTENAGEGIDLVNSSITLTLAANVEVLALSGTSAINGTGNTLNNLVRGNTANNTLNGGAGNDILEGGTGVDTLTDTAGTALFNGGAGNDLITGGASAEIYLGGLGNDTLTTGAGNDILLFNKGDGQDTFATGGTGSDTLSLGGGIAYTDLSFSKATNDLVLTVGTSDKITFKNWYATTPSKPVLNLQVVAEAMADFVQGGSDPLRDQKLENFNFAGLVGAFDTARAANTGLTSWALTNALTSFQLAGSDSAALGGDLAYQYGKNGTLAGIGITPAIDVLSNAALGASAQALTPLAGLQTGTQRLS
jgi:Ca2+-binding RTX toxin-like protein